MNVPAVVLPRPPGSGAATRVRATSAGPGVAGAETNARFRPDIETLRAIAVLSVLVYHLNARWLPGGFVGVDVFFVISGFLITAHLTSELAATGTVSLQRFYARRILRLIPASTVVLLSTLAAVAVTVPRFEWRQFGLDSAAASGYVLNWALAARSVNYLAEDAVPSPWQHYWSLGVEEQFYLVWPVLLIGLALLARRRSWGIGRMLALGAAAVVSASLAWAVQRTAAGEPSAYFTTTTRLWELGVGALGALNIARIQHRLPARLRTLLVGVGLACLVLSVARLSGAGWPGWPALLPTMATALVIVCGGADVWSPLRRALATRPLVWVGGVSYAVYLWHWPLITLVHARGPLTLALSVAVVAATLLLAWASRRWVENPVRFSPWLRRVWWRPFALGAGCLALSLLASVGLVVAAPSSALRPPPGARPAGARVLPERITLGAHPDWSRGVAWVTPSPLDAQGDVPVAYADGCQQSLTDDSPVSCSYGDLQSSRALALVGDSKALQWLPALDGWARQHRLKIVTYLKSSCPLSDADVRVSGAAYPSCRRWNAAVLQRLVALHPALVVTSSVRRVADGPSGQPDSQQAMVAGLTRSWSALLRQKIAVAVLADTPQPASNVDACVAQRPDDLAACAYDRTPAVANSGYPAQLAAVSALGGTTVNASGVTGHRRGPARLWFLDLTDVVCPDARRCPPVVGNVLIYRSGSHLTQTYVLSLSARLGGLLDRTTSS